MKGRIEAAISRILADRTVRRRQLAALTALAVLTGGNVFWQLREVGTALTEEQLCGQEAHTHTESCFDDSGALICGLEEHIHTAGCRSDAQADVETEAFWEATLPERDGLPRQEQAALIAESQLGYAESTCNFILSEDGVQHGYTRYGAWYGNPYGEWNTMFTYFCMYYAGVTAEEMPYGGNARTWQIKLNECECIQPPDTEPERGSVLLLDSDLDGEADRTGIIVDTAELLTVIEGDLEHTAAAAQYSPDDAQILGYVALPEPDTPEETIIPEESPPTEETVPAETAAASETAPLTYRAESPSGIEVQASAAEGVFPAGTVMTVTDVSREDALQAAAGSLNADAELLEAVAVDISFRAEDGTELEPAGAVSVQIKLPDVQQLGSEELALLHVADDGTAETVEAAFAGDAVTFTADGFSMYVLYYWDYNTKTEEINTATVNLNGGTGNSAENPYVLMVGEHLKLYGEDYTQGSSQFYVLNNTNERNETILVRDVYDTPDTSVSPPVLRKEYSGAHPGSCQVVYKKDNTTYFNFYVKVVEPAVIYVNTELGEIEKDKVHEYLARVHSGIPDEYIVFDNNHNPKFIRNKMGTASYRIYHGQTVELVTYVPAADYTSDMTFEIAVRGDHNNSQVLQKLSESVTQLEDSIRISAVFQAEEVPYGHRTGVKFGDTYFYIVVCGNQDLNHSDIEIADGGKYYTSKIVTYPDGTRQRIETEYGAYVSGINYCKILDEEHTVKQTYLNVDYWCDPQFSPGDAQYEYTSRYKVENGVEISSQKSFKLADAYSADFDIQVKLVPQRELVTQLHSNGTETTMPVLDISDREPVIIPSTLVHMSHQSLIDAFNKCPDHTGLDFTLKNVDHLASAIVGAQKTVSGGSLSAFDFEILDMDTVTYSYQASQQDTDGNCYVSITPEAGHVYEAYQLNLPSDGAWGNGVDGWTFQGELIKVCTNIRYYEPTKTGEILSEFAAGQAISSYSISQSDFNRILIPYLLPANAYRFNGNRAAVQGNGICLIADYKQVSTVQNDDGGYIRFPELVFGTKGTSHYRMREIIPEPAEGYLFDRSCRDFTITVTADTAGQLTASVSPETLTPAFTNTATYRLPDTGGNGTLPYYLGGTGLLAASALLMLKKRREGS